MGSIAQRPISVSGLISLNRAFTASLANSATAVPAKMTAAAYSGFTSSKSNTFRDGFGPAMYSSPAFNSATSLSPTSLATWFDCWIAKHSRSIVSLLSRNSVLRASMKTGSPRLPWYREAPRLPWYREALGRL